MNRISTYNKGINRNGHSLCVTLMALLALFALSSVSSAQGDPEPAVTSVPALTIGGNVYGGGNKGHVEGITNVTINSGVFGKNLNAAGDDIEDSQGGDIFGGARMADVNADETEMGDNEYAANVTFNGGIVRNDKAIYGGNDITGNVYGGVKVEILGSMRGSVYGGGNGSYFYTDNADLKDDAAYSDFYYDPVALLGLDGTGFTPLQSVKALNIFRPNVGDKTFVRIAGTETNRTYIGGKVFCGGNSATLDITDESKAVLHLGKYVTADAVFMGNNGENMVDNSILTAFATDNSTLTLASTAAEEDGKTLFDLYMSGVDMDIMPTLRFDPGLDETTYIGSFYLGGNRGSMTKAGTFTLPFNQPLIIYNKIVAGCNDANIAATALNAAHEGGLTNSAVTAGKTSKVELNLNQVKLSSRELTYDEGTDTYTLGWATQSTYKTIENDEEVTVTGLALGNVYGGCYTSGIINGNVVININHDLIATNAKSWIPGTGGLASFSPLSNANILASGNPLRDDVKNTAFSVFGGGYGDDTEILGNTTVNISDDGNILKVFGGGQKGYVGKINRDDDGDYLTGYSDFLKGSAVINLAGGRVGNVYGGGYEGTVTGNTTLNLLGGSAYVTFGGACNAYIDGYARTFVGADSEGTASGMPNVVNSIFGGNDLGGKIVGSNDFTDRVSNEGADGTLTKVYGYDASSNPTPDVLNASAYVEYRQGTVGGALFGGSYGDYDYTSAGFSTYTMPEIGNAFVNFRPEADSDNRVPKVYGGSKGHTGGYDKNSMQKRSYVLIDIPKVTEEGHEKDQEQFAATEVFGAGEFAGLGMRLTPAEATAEPDAVSAVIDLIRGKIAAAYGGSYEQGVTRRTVVNVPEGSAISLPNIFGGAYGVSNEAPCDVYESHVNFASKQARANNIYGGNNAFRRTLYAQVNIADSVIQLNNKYNGYAYGAGYGAGSWARYTEVNILDKGLVHEVYGGGEGGMVLNKPSETRFASDNTLDLTLDGNSTDGYDYLESGDTGLDNALAEVAQVYTDLHNDLYEMNRSIQQKYNTNVRIYEGGRIGNYAYGGGYGATAVVSGSTYIGLHGGSVNKDIYAGGTSGAVRDEFRTGAFAASANAYIRGGTARNVYGAGWKGDVGHSANTADRPGATNVYIGNLTGATFLNGIPAIQRNAYGGGEGYKDNNTGITTGSSVYGTANITLFNGYVGYTYKEGLANNAVFADTNYEEKLDDETAAAGQQKNALVKAGNIFGSGYVDNSNADTTRVTLYGGVVRNSVYGGGEIGTVGRGAKNLETDEVTISKAGMTHIYVYEGHIRQDVFGGGRGYDNLDRTGDLGTAGFVYGATDVNIRGGEIGTADNYTPEAGGYGNVFGGGNMGFVYSAYMNSTNSDGYYVYDRAVTAAESIDGAAHAVGDLTEDCRVVVEPWCKVTDEGGVNINGTHYAKGQYVPAQALNYLGKHNVDATWDKLDNSGVTIRNAVFAGGNVNVGATDYANVETVLGNATATLNDIYHRDLITVGTEHVGGLYGDGNLTFVSGYRELNITNYGTDYYSMSDNITYEEYQQLSEREKAYFELRYKCTRTYTDNLTDPDREKTYTAGTDISEDDYNALPEEHKGNWEMAGFCNIYAGRLLNTIQRADFVGVFGSRMVLQGARDRVTNVADFTNYTINRVGEVSLNKISSVRSGDSSVAEDREHGNYFGIYSIVNHMGALTSDVDMEAARTTDNDKEGYAADGTTTFIQWKEANKDNRKRNDGTSHNKVALASGVYLELTTEESAKDHKVYGPITGVVQLDLINVKPGFGGGYVYAENIHGTRGSSGNDRTLLSTYNKALAAHPKAVTNRIYKYDGAQMPYQTSGNFIHNRKQIIDDCYPVGGRYQGEDRSEGHYWFIRGEVYVYDQYISAYTGSATAYTESINIPLTITPASNGKLSVKNIQPNLYAYWYDTDPAHRKVIGEEGTEKYLMVSNNTLAYRLNEPITYWDWYQLSDAEKAHFVPETYVSVAAFKMSESAADTIPKGTVKLPAGYLDLKNSITPDEEGNRLVYDTSKEEYVDFDEVFRLSNNISHTTGYALAYDINNPSVWNKYYSPVSGTSDESSQKSAGEYGELTVAQQAGYLGGPTYTPTASRVYGQRTYSEGDIISGIVYNAYTGTGGVYSYLSDADKAKQAVFGRAYVATGEVSYTLDGKPKHVAPGTAISYAEWSSLNAAVRGSFAEAYVCVSTIELGGNNYVINGELLTAARIEELKSTYSAETPGIETIIGNSTSEAYLCTQEGLYGGKYFETGTNYSASEAWSALSADDRENFTFNKDVLDILYDPDYRDVIGYYGNRYDDELPIDYTAIYDGTTPFTYTDNGYSEDLSDEEKLEHTHTISPSDELARTVYEKLPNEQRHYSSFSVLRDGGTYHIVKKSFVRGVTPYPVGSLISGTEYGNLNPEQKANVGTYTVTSEQIEANGDTVFYFCREDYNVNENGEGTTFSDIDGTLYTLNAQVPAGTIIDKESYNDLPNRQKNFSVHGITPTETSTLYVSRESDIRDLQEDKIVTVVYEYVYEESDESGKNIEQILERHVVNVHLQFKSGVPSIDELLPPGTVLPGSTVGLSTPNVVPGAYEVLGGGFEVFASPDDVEKQKNGIPFTNNQTQVYWYQDGYYIAYFAKTYLGKTYSNAVPLSVANYHDIFDVMADKDNHMFIDHPYIEQRNKSNSKIYIDNREREDNQAKSELDLFYDLFDLSARTAEGPDEDGVMPVDHDDVRKIRDRVRGLANLDFILNSDVSPKAYSGSWTPVGGNPADPDDESVPCFGGWFHGNGFTVSGLDKSLFGKVCGDIYNVGVMGSFTSGGIADISSGHIENTWVSTTATAGLGKPVVGTVGTTDKPYVYNSYYPEEQGWTAHDADAYIDIKGRPLDDFVNGSVAYDLNSNYLQARYLLFGQHKNAAVAANDTVRSVFYSLPDGTVETETVIVEDEEVTQNKAYTISYTKDAAEWPWHSGNGFVETYMRDGDFRYSDGIIPTRDDVSYTEDGYVPVFPDDYIYFGQTLSYDLYDAGSRPPHDTHPTGVVKDHTTQSQDGVDNSRHLLLTLDSKTGNRLFRAPAYYRNGTFGKSVIFNASAAFAGEYTVGAGDDAVTYHPDKGLTAIDFSGNGDITGYQGVVPGLQADYTDRSHGYGPLLDYYGLDGFITEGITRNLLAYTPDAVNIPDISVKAKAAATNSVLRTYFSEPAYVETDAATYRNVAKVADNRLPYGHLVQQTVAGSQTTGTNIFTISSSSYSAASDQLLVDRHDYNAPVSYKFREDDDDAPGRRMWYQRTPDNYADLDKGWEAVSLPFSAELVTTQTKGEISHFYAGSEKGHEYWLREFTGIPSQTVGDDHRLTATFSLPAAGNSGAKSYTNTFLYDYYYSKDDSNDRNGDLYLEDPKNVAGSETDWKRWYMTGHGFSGYPYSAAGKPYIVGFPGARYYEFDLSGTFDPGSTVSAAASDEIVQLPAQTITFASETGVTIGVSDGETESGKVAQSFDSKSYTFVPSYLNQTFETPAAGQPEHYVLNSDATGEGARPGSSFDVVTGDDVVKTVSAFRPYFTGIASSGAPGRSASATRGFVESIVFGSAPTAFGGKDTEGSGGDGLSNGLYVYVEKGAIVVESALKETVSVSIINASGLTARSFSIAPEGVVRTPVPGGIYMVAGRKLLVR